MLAGWKRPLACRQGYSGSQRNWGVVRLIGVYIDITDRRTAELALRQNEKLAAVGRLASTISHEINNPLEATTNLLYLAKSAALSQRWLSI